MSRIRPEYFAPGPNDRWVGADVLVRDQQGDEEDEEDDDDNEDDSEEDDEAGYSE